MNTNMKDYDKQKRDMNGKNRQNFGYMRKEKRL